uniref:Uncharacterized protein n=1 Tax=viral metagenome TaxID=1070528 RepID=A0A6C0HDX0_9ZZZZ
MQLIHLIILLAIIAYFLNRKQMVTRCAAVPTKFGLTKVCVTSRENFDIPMKPTALCEARCATDYDHAQLLQRGILAESCIMKCHNLL